jgi:hypothetical protein
MRDSLRTRRLKARGGRNGSRADKAKAGYLGGRNVPAWKRRWISSLGGKVSGPIFMHKKWHRDRGISNPKCQHCVD